MGTRRPIAWKFDGECIRLTSHKVGRGGYAVFGRNGKLFGFAREIARRFKGLIPGLVTRHSCDNPWCVNPDHILIGTQADNMRDAVSRKRMASGPRHYCYKHGRSKLKEYQREYNRMYHAAKMRRLSSQTV